MPWILTPNLSSLEMHCPKCLNTLCNSFCHKKMNNMTWMWQETWNISIGVLLFILQKGTFNRWLNYLHLNNIIVSREARSKWIKQICTTIHSHLHHVQSFLVASHKHAAAGRQWEGRRQRYGFLSQPAGTGRIIQVASRLYVWLVVMRAGELESAALASHHLTGIWERQRTILYKRLYTTQQKSNILTLHNVLNTNGCNKHQRQI